MAVESCLRKSGQLCHDGKSNLAPGSTELHHWKAGTNGSVNIVRSTSNTRNYRCQPVIKCRGRLLRSSQIKSREARNTCSALRLDLRRTTADPEFAAWDSEAEKTFGDANPPQIVAVNCIGLCRMCLERPPAPVLEQSSVTGHWHPASCECVRCLQAWSQIMDIRRIVIRNH